MGKTANPRRVTLPTPRCPLCYAVMEEAQLMWYEAPRAPGLYCWHEVWGCDSCHTEHTFPARIEFLQMAANSILLERSGRTIHLPK